MLARKLMGADSVAPVDLAPMELVIDTSLGDGTPNIGFYASVFTNISVDWGDGATEAYPSSGTKYHAYAQGGVYTIKIYGAMGAFYTYYVNYIEKITGCNSFGEYGIGSLYYGFAGCVNLTTAPTSLPTGIKQLDFLFQDAASFNQDISSWNTANVTAMFSVFKDAIAFNQDIGSWNTANATSMTNMFNGATAFSQDLSGWCVGNHGAEPSNFAPTLAASFKPVWGTCPGYVASGSVTYIGQSTGTDNATLPAHQAGDLILAFAFRDGSTSSPSPVSGWSFIGLAGANLASARLYYKVAESSSEVSGTWTNATTAIFLVYRGVEIGGIGVLETLAKGESSTVDYAANGYWQGLSRVIAFSGHRSTDTGLGRPLNDLTLIVNPVDSVDEAAAFQSTVDNYGDWPLTSVTVYGTSSGWISFVLRLRVPITKI
jgi:surface protein